MPKLRDAALAALAARVKAQADEEAAIKQQQADAAMTRLAKTKVKTWFPAVTWEFVGDLSDGTTLVKEKDGLDTVIGITPVYADGHPEGAGPTDRSIGVYTLDSAVTGQWSRSWELKEAADLGSYLDATEPKAEPAPEPAAAEWVQPTGAHDAYANGAVVSHNGKTWTSTVAANVWEPGVSGWRAAA